MRKIITILVLLPAFVQSQNMHVAWARQSVGDTSCYQLGGFVSTDPSGYIYCAGGFYGPSIAFGNIVLFNSSTTGSDMWLAKFDSLGNVIWAKSFGAAGQGQVGASAIATDLSGNVLLCGSISGGMFILGTDTIYSPGAFVIKLDGLGNILWATEATGWNNSIADITADELGDMYIVGNCLSALQLDTIVISPPPNVNASFVAKIDKNGKGKWAVEIGDLNSNGVYGYSVATDKLGHVYTCGTFLDTLTVGPYVVKDIAGNYDTYVAKFDYNGSILNLRKEECATGDCQGTSLDCDQQGNLILGGGFSGNSMQFGSVFVINTPGSPYTVMFVVKYDSAGTAMWARGCNKSGYVGDVSADNQGNAYASGTIFSTSVTFGSYNVTVPYNSPDPMFMVKYDYAGTVQYAHLFQSGRSYSHVAPDSYGNAYVASDFNATFPMQIANDTLFSVSHRNFFLVRISDDLAAGVPVQSNLHGSVMAYPNPVMSELFVEGQRNYQSVTLYNASGELLLTDKATKNNARINFSSYPPGIYTLRIIDASGNAESLKVIKTE